MNLLLDTHTFMWFVNGDPILGKEARDAIENTDNRKFFSVASLWEIAIKINIGKLSLSKPYNEIQGQLEENHIEVLHIDFSHTLKLVTLPLHHRDPFDRLIIAQAITEGMSVITKDENFKYYTVKIIW